MGILSEAITALIHPGRDQGPKVMHFPAGEYCIDKITTIYSKDDGRVRDRSGYRLKAFGFGEDGRFYCTAEEFIGFCFEAVDDKEVMYPQLVIAKGSEVPLVQAPGGEIRVNGVPYKLRSDLQGGILVVNPQLGKGFEDGNQFARDVWRIEYPDLYNNPFSL